MRPWMWSLLVFAAIVGVQFAGGKTTERKTPVPQPALDTPLTAAKSEATAVLAGGCFWGIQAVFQHVKGVSKVTAGYSGGEADTAHYEVVGYGQSGHAESVQIKFDPSQISYGQLLRIYFSVAHDPTQRNRQGPGLGTQYRSAIFYVDEEQKRIAKAYLAQLGAANVFAQPIVTEVVPFHAFCAAEDYHQDYLAHHPYSPYIVMNDQPKLGHLKNLFPELYR